MTQEQSNQKIEIEVDKIIGEIRNQILSQQFKETGHDVQLAGNYFSADFYERLYQASVSQQELVLQTAKSNVPLIGGLIDRLRTMVHQVILFYLNQFVAEQARINQLTVSLIKEMSQEIERLGNQQGLEQDAQGAASAE